MTKGQLKVLMLTTYADYGGPFPKLAPLLIRGLRDAGANVDVLGWSAHTSGAEPLLAKILGRSADLVRVLRCVRHRRPDVIYVATSHTWHSLLRDSSLALAVTRRGPPIVLHMHGSACERLGQPGQNLFTLFSTQLARRAAVVLLLSTEELAPWRRLCPEVHFEVVVNPFVPVARVEPSEVAPPDRSRTPALLTVARLIPEKGLFELVEALEVVAHSRQCRLVIAGTGPAGHELMQRVRELRLSDSVELVGYLVGQQLDAAYRSADVFVLPSHSEGFPLSVMEAMGYGLPVITTRIRGCADHLVPDVHALFVPPRDPAALGAAIVRLLDDYELRERMGRNNLQKVADFAPEVVMPRYAQILEAAVAGGKKGTHASAESPGSELA